MFTMCPPPCVSICRIARCETWKNPARFTEILRGEIGLGVIGERLGDEYPGVVDQRIDPAKLLDRTADNPVRDRRIGDVAGDGQYIRRGDGLDGPRVGDDAEATIEEPANQSRPDTLRSRR